MKNIFLISVVLIASFWACQDDDYDAPNEFSDVGIYTSQGLSPLAINIFDYITFANLSQGYTHHEWTIDEGNFFIEGPFAWRDSMEVYEERIINPGETTSTEKTINVYFKQSGFQNVRMFNIFDEYVEFRGFQDGAPYTMKSENVNGKWVIDTTFTVKVYDTIIPEIEVRQAGALLDLESTDTIYVEAGDVLEFTDVTTIGEPTGRFWWVRTPSIEGVEPETVASSNQEVANIVFKKLGVFEAGVNVTRSGQNIPGDGETLVIERPIKVIPSSKPFELTGTIAEQEDETIRIPFNGEFAPFFNAEAFFEVKVNGTLFPIASVAVNDDDATFIDIVLQDPIYRPDVITVSLLDGSGIQSTDTRTPVSFTDVPVAMHDVNLLGPNFGSFEDAGASWQPFAPAWGANQGGLEWTTERAYHGDYSMKMTMTNGERCAAEAYLDQPIIFEPGVTYEVKYWLYIESTTNRPGSFALWFLNQWAQHWGNINQPVGQWVEMSYEITDWSPLARLYHRINPVAGADMVVYFDNFYIVKKEERP